MEKVQSEIHFTGGGGGSRSSVDHDHFVADRINSKLTENNV
jgi:hypothetical protein